jgi:hypothetical protein
VPSCRRRLDFGLFCRVIASSKLMRKDTRMKSASAPVIRVIAGRSVAVVVQFRVGLPGARRSGVEIGEAHAKS